MRMRRSDLIEELEIIKLEVEWTNPVSTFVVEEYIDGIPRYVKERQPNREAMRRAAAIQRAIDAMRG